MGSSETEPMFVIAKGSEVEVTSDEEGFKGAWYRATLEETPTKSKRKKLLVKYATLVKEDGSTPLTESVDPAFIRPIPPDHVTAGINFEEGDVVDAGYRDGWWTGVVRKTLENDRYLVYFDNPPDVIEFNGKDLRAHLDWSDGKWVRPEKQQSTKSMRSSGTAVEVRLEKEHMQDIWLPALVIKENEDNTFYVKYKPKRDSDDVDAMSIVGSQCIRPIPPTPSNDREYALLELVDALDELGWREGVITRLLSGKRYTVYFKPQNESKEFGHSEIRPSMDWNNGIWLKASKMKSGHNKGTGSSKQVVEAKKSSHAIQNKSEERTPSARLRKKCGERKTTFSESYAVPSAKKMKLTLSLGATKQSILSKLSEGENAEESQVSTDRSRKVQAQARHSLSVPKSKVASRRVVESAAIDQNSATCETPLSKIAARKKQPLTGELGNNIADDAKNGNLPARSPRVIISPKSFVSPVVLGLQAVATKEIQGKASSKKTLKLTKHLKDLTSISAGLEETKEQKTENNSQKRKRGRPRKFISPELPLAACKVSDQKATEVSNRKAKRPERAVAEDISTLADDGQPLSTWIRGNLSTGAEELRLSSARNGASHAGEKQIENRVESPKDDLAELLPFVKRSPIWKTIESMEVFRIVPQRPHFTPLLETKEEYREGSAIGIMVTFSGLFDKVANLQFDDPRTTFDNIIESLLDLEKHGFDVTVPQSRINNLLSIKDKQRQILDESKYVEEEIAENRNKRRKYEEDMEGIRRKIIELQEQQKAVKKVKESVHMELSQLQTYAATLKQRIQNVEEEFRKTATASWKRY